MLINILKTCTSRRIKEMDRGKNKRKLLEKTIRSVESKKVNKEPKFFGKRHRTNEKYLKVLSAKVKVE